MTLFELEVLHAMFKRCVACKRALTRDYYVRTVQAAAAAAAADDDEDVAVVDENGALLLLSGVFFRFRIVANARAHPRLGKAFLCVLKHFLATSL